MKSKVPLNRQLILGHRVAHPLGPIFICLVEIAHQASQFRAFVAALVDECRQWVSLRAEICGGLGYINWNFELKASAVEPLNPP